MDITVLDGIIIGGVGGAIAGVAVWLINLCTEKITEKRHKKRIYDWLYGKTKQEHVADWNNIPGNDSETFLMFLREDPDIDWTENAEIVKSDDGKTIRILKDEKFAKVTMDKEEKKAKLEIGGRTIYNLKIKKENGKLNIYKEKWRSTRTIASYRNLTENQVRYICSIDERIGLSTGEKEDLWGINEFTRPDNDDQKSV